MLLIRTLLEKGIIDKDKAASLEYKVESEDRREEEVVLEQGLVPEISLFKIKSEKLNIPLIKVESQKIDPGLLRFIPERSAEYYKMVPLALKGNVLKVGMVYPKDLNSRETLKFLGRQNKFDAQVFLITLSDYKKVMGRYRDLRREVVKAVEEMEEKMKEEGRFVKEGKELFEEGRLVEKAPVSKIIDVLLKHAIDGGASDVHIEALGRQLRVRFRILGNLHSSIFLPVSYLSALVARVKILANLRIDEKRIPQDGRFSKQIENRKVDFRVSTFPTAQGEKVAIRILDTLKGLKTLESLGLHEEGLRIFKKAIDSSSGMIIVSGPTGSGKSTTLYAALRYLNKENVNIVTLEDPVEYFIEGVNQSQVRPEIGYTFARGLRHVLRQDPDIVMVGEMRDPESANLAVHAALTGHLVLSTLHTSSAINVIPRLLDLGIEDYLLPVSLSVVLSQRLIRSLCEDCKQKVKAKGKVKDLILEEMSNLPRKAKKNLRLPVKSPFIWKAVGCEKCGGRGYSGRIGIFEVLRLTDQLINIILKEECSKSKMSREAQRQGMMTMRQDGIIKALNGVSTIEEVLRVTKNDSQEG